MSVEGLGRFMVAVDAMVERSRLAARTAVGLMGHALEAEVKSTLTRYSHPPGTPTPSPPGEPPAIVSGTLRRSVRVDGPNMLSLGTYEARVGPTVIYGRRQELGGSDSRGVVLPARPFMAPSHLRLVTDGRYQEIWVSTLRRML